MSKSRSCPYAKAPHAHSGVHTLTHMYPTPFIPSPNARQPLLFSCLCAHTHTRAPSDFLMPRRRPAVLRPLLEDPLAFLLAARTACTTHEHCDPATLWRATAVPIAVAVAVNTFPNNIILLSCSSLSCSPCSLCSPVQCQISLPGLHAKSIFAACGARERRQHKKTANATQQAQRRRQGRRRCVCAPLRVCVCPKAFIFFLPIPSLFLLRPTCPLFFFFFSFASSTLASVCV